MHFPSGAESHGCLGCFIVQCVTESNYPTYRQAFNQLITALQSGNVSAAQNALASSPAVLGSRPFAQALREIGADLQSGDVKGPQQALASLQQQQQTHGHPNNDDNTGTVSIDIQVTETFDSSNIVDIKA